MVFRLWENLDFPCVFSLGLRLNSMRLISIKINSKKRGGCAPRTPLFGARALKHTWESRPGQEKPLPPDLSFRSEKAEAKNWPDQSRQNFSEMFARLGAAGPVKLVENRGGLSSPEQSEPRQFFAWWFSACGRT